MRTVNGNVCVALNDAVQLIYGRPVSAEAIVCEHIESNGFATFRRRQHATRAQRVLAGRPDFRRVIVCRLRMSIAETEDDLTSLGDLKRPSFVIILSGDDVQLLGRRTPGQPAIFDSCASLRDRGVKTFDSFREADYSATDAARQSVCRVTIASFRLR